MNVSELIAHLHALDMPDAHVRIRIGVLNDYGFSTYETDIEGAEVEYNQYENGAEVGFIVIGGELSI
jgi:hypothetical protein